MLLEKRKTGINCLVWQKKKCLLCFCATRRPRRRVCELSHRIRSPGKHDPHSPHGFLKWPAFRARGEPFQGRGGIGPKVAPLSRPGDACSRWKTYRCDIPRPSGPLCFCTGKNSVWVSLGGPPKASLVGGAMSLLHVRSLMRTLINGQPESPPLRREAHCASM